MQHRTRIKICGITRVEDALAAVQAGVDAIGLVFYAKSKRYVTLEQARTITRALPPFVTSVGLFVDADEAFIERAIETVALDVLQFHGAELPTECERYTRPYIKAVRVQGEQDIRRAAGDYVTAQALLLDSFNAQQQGGTGESFDWSLIPAQCQLPLILAGGLSAANVAEAIARVKPYAVDVSSGVESAPGIKSEALITQFVTEVTS